MSEYKICVYAIAKNEEKFVDRWMDSMREADFVVVTDTGSTDGTMEKLRERGAAVYEEKIDPWRFDTARNLSLAHVPEDADICVCTDLDEVLSPGWREILEKLWKQGDKTGHYLYHWSHRPDGSPDVSFEYAKIHARHGFRWVYPVHECLRYNGAEPEKTVFLSGVVLDHYPDQSKSRGQYLSLLELSAQENPEDSQVIFWLGREYMYYNRYDDSIRTLERYLKLPAASWNEERCAAMRFLSNCCQGKGDSVNARRWLYRAVAECPEVREPYLQLARLGYAESDWPLVYLMVTEALKITEKSGSYLLEPEAWGSAPYDYGAIACYRLGLFRQSHAYAKRALEIEPNDPRLAKNLEMIDEKLENNF